MILNLAQIVKKVCFMILNLAQIVKKIYSQLRQIDILISVLFLNKNVINP